MSAAAAGEWPDDWMAVADAVGVSPTGPAHPVMVGPAREQTTGWRPHPLHAREFTNLALELRTRTWAAEAGIEPMHPDAPIALLPAHEPARQPVVAGWDTDGDYPCEGDDCDRILCAHRDGPCATTAGAPACPHGQWLCEQCRTAACRECRAEQLAIENGWWEPC